MVTPWHCLSSHRQAPAVQTTPPTCSQRSRRSQQRRIESRPGTSPTAAEKAEASSRQPKNTEASSNNAPPVRRCAAPREANERVSRPCTYCVVCACGNLVRGRDIILLIARTATISPFHHGQPCLLELPEVHGCSPLRLRLTAPDRRENDGIVERASANCSLFCNPVLCEMIALIV